MRHKIWIKVILIVVSAFFIASCSEDEPKTFVGKYVKACTKTGGGNTPQLCKCVGTYIEKGLEQEPNKEYLLNLITTKPKSPELQEIRPLFYQATLYCYSG